MYHIIVADNQSNDGVPPLYGHLVKTESCFPAGIPNPDHPACSLITFRAPVSKMCRFLILSNVTLVLLGQG
jgi:hypothetical protein